MPFIARFVQGPGAGVGATVPNRPPPQKQQAELSSWWAQYSLPGDSKLLQLYEAQLPSMVRSVQCPCTGPGVGSGPTVGTGVGTTTGVGVGTGVGTITGVGVGTGVGTITGIGVGTTVGTGCGAGVGGAGLGWGVGPLSPTTRTSAQFLNCSPQLMGPPWVGGQVPLKEQIPLHHSWAFHPCFVMFWK